MADTYTLIEKIAVGAAGASSITFTSIPQTYTDLKVVLCARATDTFGQTWYDSYITLNSTSGTGRVLYGSNSGNLSGVDSSNSPVYGITSSGATANVFGNAEFYLPNYTGTTQKSLSVDSVSENNATAAIRHIGANLHNVTTGVTSITITPYNSPTAKFAQYSTFYLYGIAKEGVTPSLPSAPYATGGDSIVFDGTYWIHTFTSSGTFTPKKALSCDYLVVAGGAGGSIGGGGAGGLRSTVTATGGGGSLESALSLAANTGYTVTVGAGGAANTDGNNSVFSTITSNKGGSGGSNGSGTGGAVTTGASGTTSAGSAGTANQGYAGGTSTKFGSTTPTYWGGAGGGGAGAIGGAGRSDSNPATSAGGNGGNGVATSISGSSVTYAGGGGGYNEGNTNRATGGTGGGGNADNSSNSGGTAGTANTGGGGGGRFTGGYGYAGGSGIVIVRYAA